ncbi:T9SS type A sorting domain-containing protein [Winogradskyella aquimaris]|uniref:T9SS type A sorting domain-containing protein n=1 Tax=Winogradskyella aquimaris TaxID=864074 RepID=A0ABU5EJE1_9FLAO|nr:T9SS type A sorting domain-containing protein [Winogradskyella aquimaris]MDY2586343.1 T9SS type A sorting domain-containing protein [Winogradskyella aquimaris]
MKKNYYLLLLLLSCALNFGFGQSIFSNTIDGIDPNNDNPFITGQVVDANITVSGIGRSTGITGNNATNRYNARNWNTASIDLTKYFEFTLNPNAGYEIDFISFEYTGQRSATGPTDVAFRSSVDGYSTNIGTPIITGNTIDLSGVNYQDITTAITFRIYAWNASTAAGTYSINDFTFNGVVTSLPCSTTTTWTNTGWDNGVPDINTSVILDFNYDTTDNGNINACELTINAGSTLRITDNSFVNVKNNIVADGDIILESQGAVVQIEDAATTTGTGTITVQKFTTQVNGPLEYTYWSSPVNGETIENTFGVVPTSRRFFFNAANFEDLLTEVDNTGVFNAGQDDIDDTGDAWQLATGIMAPGIGYATTVSPFLMFPTQQQFNFVGPFNNGTYQTTLVNDSGGLYNDWNFIGNPYPSAIDTDVFFTVNAGIVNNIYLWSQATAADANAQGNDGQNFSSADYAIISASGVNTAGGDLIMPNDYVPSGQGFFVEALTAGPVTFNNSMRVTGNNDQFFRNANSTNSNRQVLWLNLRSDNGVAKQIAIAHIDGATDLDDGTFYDVKVNGASAAYAKLYSTINDDSDNEYVIQCKSPSSLDLDEIIPLGFENNIDSPTIFTISIAQFEGDFYNNNEIYLKDNLLNTTHNLNASDYSFTSETGIFNSRFEIVFNNSVLSIDDNVANGNDLTISELNNGEVRLKVSNPFTIKTVEILDILGRQIYKLNGNSAVEVYNLSKLSNAAYIAKVTLSNGQTISKKAIKRQ